MGAWRVSGRGGKLALVRAGLRVRPATAGDGQRPALRPGRGRARGGRRVVHRDELGAP